MASLTLEPLVQEDSEPQLGSATSSRRADPKEFIDGSQSFRTARLKRQPLPRLDSIAARQQRFNQFVRQDQV